VRIVCNKSATTGSETSGVETFLPTDCARSSLSELLAGSVVVVLLFGELNEQIGSSGKGYFSRGFLTPGNSPASQRGPNGRGRARRCTEKDLFGDAGDAADGVGEVGGGGGVRELARKSGGAGKDDGALSPDI